jgi:hypothetical protein
MRFSTKPDDPGFAAWDKLRASGGEAHAFLDGKEIPLVVTVDDEQGFILAGVPDEIGCASIAPDNETFLEQRLEGKVEVKITEGSAACSSA